VTASHLATPKVKDSVKVTDLVMARRLGLSMATDLVKARRSVKVTYLLMV
jgi:hypothetical protein